MGSTPIDFFSFIQLVGTLHLSFSAYLDVERTSGGNFPLYKFELGTIFSTSKCHVVKMEMEKKAPQFKFVLWRGLFYILSLQTDCRPKRNPRNEVYVERFFFFLNLSIFSCQTLKSLKVRCSFSVIA